MLTDRARLAVALALALCAAASPAQAAGGRFVGRSATRFALGDETFHEAHGNQYYLWYKPSFMTDEILLDARRLGLNALRLFAFCEGQNKDGFCFQPQPGQYDEATFRKLDYALYRARLMGVRMILPLVNQWDDAFGGMRQYVNWAKQADPESIPEDLRAGWLEHVHLSELTHGSPDFQLYQRYHDLFYTHPIAKQLYKQYVETLLSRRNRYTGVAYRHDPTILMWELANEPRCESDPSGDTLRAWIADMAAFIKQRDPIHLLSTGEEGWYRDPANPGDWRYNGSLGVDYIAHHQVPGIDACSFHLLPNDNDQHAAAARQWIREHVADCHRAVGKPAYVGEFGWRAERSTKPRVETLLHGFSADTEGWSADWAYAGAPTRVASPSYDGGGALEYRSAGPFGPGQSYPDAGGAFVFPGDGADLSGFDWLSARVFVPVGAPEGLSADFYAASGPDWRWSNGPGAALVPGQWHEVAIRLDWLAEQTAVRKFGVRVIAGSSAYDGPVYYDQVVGIQGPLRPVEEQMAERNQRYADWRDTLLQAGADGAGFWYLSGVQENGLLDPDPSHYAVFYPEDGGTVTVIQELAAQLAQRSGLPLTQWEPCEAPGLGSASSGYSDATGFALDSSIARRGGSACRLEYEVGGFGKAYWEFSPLDENWTERPSLSFFVHSPQDGLGMTVAVSTGPQWDWHESTLHPLAAGWNNVRIDLASAVWKSAATNWEPRTPIQNLHAVHRVSFGLFGYAAGGSIRLDEIRLSVLPRITRLVRRGSMVRFSGVDEEGRTLRLEFSHRIDGGAWSPWSRRRYLSIRSLTAAVGSGEHVIEVRARDRFGAVSEPKPLRVVIEGVAGSQSVTAGVDAMLPAR